jgi:protein gp37
MADGTHISWAEATWNPITGCAVLSPGCKRCYAMRLAGGRLKNHRSRQGLTMDTPKGPVWNGDVRFNEQWLDQPLRWRRPRMIFVCAHADLFYERVPDEWIRRIFEVMFHAHQHTFMMLTKRTARMRRFLENRATLRNVWIGASVEDQRHADERIPDLLATPAALRWISAEPLLGPVDVDRYLYGGHRCLITGWPGDHPNSCGDCDPCLNSFGFPKPKGIGWIVVGGESQGSDRPTHPDWFRSLRDQCIAAGVPFHFKQWGDWLARWQDGHKGRHPSPDKIEWRHFTTPGELGAFAIKIGSAKAGRELDGRTWDEFPKSSL